jgi:membrane protein DedA with SNARE-associated domain
MTENRKNSASQRSRFLIKNLLRGFIWLAGIVVGYFYIKNNYGFDLKILLGPLYENWTIIYLIFLVSEVVLGIIPPEFFMFWALRHEVLAVYIQNIVALMLISYFAGIIGYFIGFKLSGTRIFRIFRKNFLRKTTRYFNEYGGFLLIVAALTPIPFSGICMLVGTVNYNFKRFVWISMMRFVRFIVYAFIIWQANVFN